MIDTKREEFNYWFKDFEEFKVLTDEKKNQYYKYFKGKAKSKLKPKDGPK